jgi:hypothetical protein
MPDARINIHNEKVDTGRSEISNPVAPIATETARGVLQNTDQFMAVIRIYLGFRE